MNQVLRWWQPPKRKKVHTVGKDANTDDDNGAMAPSQNSHKDDIHLDQITNDDQKREERLDNFHYLPGSWEQWKTPRYVRQHNGPVNQLLHAIRVEAKQQKLSNCVGTRNLWQMTNRARAQYIYIYI